MNVIRKHIKISVGYAEGEKKRRNTGETRFTLRPHLVQMVHSGYSSLVLHPDPLYSKYVKARALRQLQGVS